MVSNLRKWVRNESLRFTLMSMAASALNMLTLVLYGRVFSVEDYGVVATLQAMVANIAILMTPLQMILCRTIAAGQPDSAERRGKLLSLVLVINALEAVVLLAASLPVMRYLHLSLFLDYALFLLLVLANNAFLVLNGILQGKQAFFPLGWAGIALYGVKMVLSLLLGALGLGPRAMLLGFLAGEAAALCILLLRLRRLLKGAPFTFRFGTDGPAVREYLRIMAVYFVVSLYMNNGDLLLANLYTPEKTLGLYSVAMTLSKLSVFLIATPLATLLLPRVAAAREDPPAQRRLLRNSEGIALGLSAACGLVLTLLAGWLIPLLYGESYADAACYMAPCAVFSAVLSGFWIFYQYTLATDLEKPFLIASLSLGALTLGAVLVFRPGPAVLPLLLAGGMLLTAAAAWLLRVRKGGKRPS